MRVFFMFFITCWILFIDLFSCSADSFTSLPPEYQKLQMDSFLCGPPMAASDGSGLQEPNAGSPLIPTSPGLTVATDVNAFLFPKAATDQSAQLSESVQSRIQSLTLLPLTPYQPDTNQFLAYAEDLFDARFLCDIISPNITYENDVLATHQIQDENLLEKILPIPEPSTFLLVLPGIVACRQIIFRHRTLL